MDPAAIHIGAGDGLKHVADALGVNFEVGVTHVDVGGRFADDIHHIRARVGGGRVAAVAAGGRGAVMNQRLGGALRRGKDGVCQRRTVGGVRLRHRQGFDGPFLHLDLDGILDGGVGVKGGRQIEGDGLRVMEHMKQHAV